MAQFHHVHIKAKKPRMTARWWEDMFGAKILPEFAFGTMLFTPVELDGVRINITGHAPEEAEGMAEPQAIPYWGLEHVGIEVDDMDAILSRFEEQGFKIYVRRPGPGGYEIAFVDAPDGVVLELLYQTQDI
ncbi:MAG: VOC family protein [Acidimicrobiia bacterium]|nr:VOC family protein [Acidimicrobiia bacterium]